MKQAATKPGNGRPRIWRTFAMLVLPVAVWVALQFLLAPAPGRAAETLAQPTPGSLVRFAVVGDFGSDGQAPADVGRLVASWKPDFVITTGDNNYPDGAAPTIDANIGQYYHSFIAPYRGSYGQGAVTNKFFPSLGNHDWDAPDAKPYLDYFTLPGNERYYDFARGPVHFFVVDSDPREPDGITAGSAQATWLHGRLAASHEQWKLVYFHHPAYSSGLHGSTTALQWPYSAWGASAVLNGHDHDYERLVVDGFPYFVNGLGGRSIYGFGEPIAGSIVRYADDYGAILVEAGDLTMTYRFITRQGNTIDTYVTCAVRDWHPGGASCLTTGKGGRAR